jgi:glycosyltransferase involved in cell wall biosynthesis
MRVLVVTAYYPTVDRPQYGVYVREFAHALGRIAQVGVLHFDGHLRPSHGGWRSFEVEEDESISEGIPTFRVRWALAPGAIPSLPIRLAAGVAAYREIQRRFRPDLIHAHVFTAGLVSVLIGRFARKPVVITEHTSIFFGNPPRSTMVEARIAYRLADLVLPVSTAQREAMVAKGLKADYAVVPNVVDCGVFYPPGGDSPAMASGPVRLLFVGAFRGRFGKGIPELLHATRLLLDRGVDVRVTMIGAGPRKEEAEEMARSLGLAGSVFCAGGLPIAEVAERMRNSHLLIAPSTAHETFSLPVAEAQACGLPVVASRIGAIPETLSADAGILVEPGDPVALADAIETGLRDYERWDRQAIAKSAERFCVENVIDLIEGLYSSVKTGR